MFIWYLAFIPSNFVEMPSAYCFFIHIPSSYRTCEYEMLSFLYIFHPPILRLPYIKVVFVSIMHQPFMQS